MCGQSNSVANCSTRLLLASCQKTAALVCAGQEAKFASFSIRFLLSEEALRPQRRLDLKLLRSANQIHSIPLCSEGIEHTALSEGMNIYCEYKPIPSVIMMIPLGRHLSSRMRRLLCRKRIIHFSEHLLTSWSCQKPTRAPGLQQQQPFPAKPSG